MVPNRATHHIYSTNFKSQVLGRKILRIWLLNSHTIELQHVGQVGEQESRADQSELEILW